ncbi:MAG: peptidylprolyl isomerase [Betaproteobacteria bacterium]|jgi:Parvulin-like peptidyl-prolyl isomerase|nr:peptidylprolyl isomerase [Betaproteobacteria bacterium]
MKLKHTLLSLTLVGGSLALTLAYAEQNQPSASSAPLVVNGETIPESRIQFVTNMQISRGHAAGADLDRGVRNELVILQLLNDQARKDGLNKDPGLEGQLDFMKQQLTAAAFHDHYLKTHPVSDQALHAEYDRMKAEAGEHEYLTEHILVDNEAEAQAIIAQLKKGGNFEKIAKEKSKDPGSKANGGKLGWAAPGVYDKSFGAAMAKLKKGETTDTPVKSPFGYHIIRVIDIRPLKAPPFDDVKTKLSQALQEQAFGQYIQQLQSQAKIQGR